MVESVSDCWTIEKLHVELRRFEERLRAEGLAPTSIRTYVDRTAIFLRWLVGDYHPQGPRAD